MPKLNIAPTKSNLLLLRHQLAFAVEGYDLLEQKRQILIIEMMSRLNKAREAEGRVAAASGGAFGALREAVLDAGSEAVDRAALGVTSKPEADVTGQHVMGMHLPAVKTQVEAAGVQFGLSGTSANTDEAMKRFAALLPLLAQLAELETAVLRLARELRKTQRRCNALSRIFIPNYRDTIAYVASSLEERERESIVILKMIRDRLSQSADRN